MATCTVSGKFLDAQGNAVSGAAVRFNIESPVLDASGNALAPVELSTATATDGTWSLVLIQDVSGILTLDLNRTSSSPVTKYTFSLVVPESSTATFAQCWADSSSFSGASSGFPASVAQGGTGLATLTANGVLLGNGTSPVTSVSPGTAGNLLTSDGTTWTSAAPSVGTTGNLTDAGTDGITVTGGTGAVLGTGTSISQHVADTTHSGYLSSTDWNDFSGKQAAGNYVTALTGDAAASGPGSAAITLATVNSNVGSFTNASVTVNAKGLVTAASSGTAPVTAVSVASANGFAGSSSGGATPALTVSTSVTGVLKGNGTAVSAATSGTDYSAGTSGLATGILKSTTTTGGLSIAVAGDFPTLNQNTSGTAASVSGTNVVTNSNLSQMAAHTFKGNNTGSTANALDLTVAQLTAELNAVVGDSGSGGTKGLVPAPASGDAAANKVLGAGGSWVTQSGASFTAPTAQCLTSTGTTTGYVFTITSGSASANATYTNNAHTFTVLATIASQTTLFTSGASAPSASGTLTKASGTGDVTITFSAATALATYTTPTSPSTPLYLKIKMVGGGGGGGGGGSSAGNGTAGTATYFGTNLLIATGGGGGSFNGANSAAGGTATVNSPATKLTALAGAYGAGSWTDTSGMNGAGGMGGVSPFGGAGAGAGSGTSPAAGAVANSGSGGGGGGGQTITACGGGGSAGGFIEAFVGSPGATYYYAIGAAGSTGSGADPGASGGTGVVIVEEHYQ